MSRGTESIVDPVKLMRTEAWPCLQGLTDAEYFWEPVDGSWSVCRRELARVDELAGRGPWVLEFPSGPVDPAPLTTIAWRLTHLHLLNSVYNDVLFGTGQRTFHDFPIPATASAAIAGWRAGVDTFIAAISTLSIEDFDRVVAMPWNEQSTIRGWTEWFTLHNTHHCAEVGCLRDFHRVLGRSRPTAPARAPSVPASPLSMSR